jgi:hypothetical protein
MQPDDVPQNHKRLVRVEIQVDELAFLEFTILGASLGKAPPGLQKVDILPRELASGAPVSSLQSPVTSDQSPVSSDPALIG